MNRNSGSRFSLAPTVTAPRSTLDLSHKHCDSFNCGELVPITIPLEVLPGDTWKIKTSKVCRMQTLKTPIYDDVFLDQYWFFVPSRLVWDHWREFMGENNDSAWIPQVTYSVPQIESPANGWNVGTIADHLGIPPLVSNLSVNALPFRAVALIYDQWFRSEVVQDPLVINTGDSTVTGTNGTSYITDTALGGACPTVNKTFDLYTGCTIDPQKGNPVTFNALSGIEDASVYTVGMPNEWFAPSGLVPNQRSAYYADAVKNSYPVMYERQSPFDGDGIAAFKPYPGIVVTSKQTTSTDAAFTPYSDSGGKTQYYRGNGATPNVAFTNVKLNDLTVSGSAVSSPIPVNLVADLSPALSAISINDLRQAFQIQRWLERASYSGSRYIETLRAHFGVISPDARQQRSEYLGGNRLPLNIRQITQNSETTNTSPLGDVAGQSVTADNHFDFEKSFTEHGYIIGLACARYHHTYQQGIPKTFLRKTMFDYFWPEFNSLGNQPVSNAEIYAQGTSDDAEVFGYQEAWYDYRYIPNTVSGLMRSVSNSGLDSWHLADNYSQLPTLSAGWLAEDKTNLDRVLTVTSAVSDQIFSDFYFDVKATRRMTLYSIPGLIDHF